MKENFNNLDNTDLVILANIQKEGRISNSYLSEKVNLSETPCWRRWKNLEANGYIDGYHATLNRKKLGFDISGFTQVELGNHEEASTDLFEDFVRSVDWIPLCHCVAGSSDYFIQVIAKDLEEYYEHLNQIRRIKGVSSLTSSISVKEIKNSTIVPVI